MNLRKLATIGIVLLTFSVWAQSQGGDTPTLNDKENLGIVGTNWTRTDSYGNCSEVFFQAQGYYIRQYLSNGPSTTGRWIQDGSTVQISVASGAWRESAVISGKVMTGDGVHNKGDRWTWKAEFQPEQGDCLYRARYALRARESHGYTPIDKAVWKKRFRPGFDEVIAAFDQGEILTADKLLRALAEEGDPRAQSILAARLAGGAVSRQPLPDQAVDWYRKAASIGYPEAENNLGGMYHDGKGVPQDYEMARKWYEFANLDGDPWAPYNIGQLYEFGLGVQRDHAEAVNWYRKAAGHGNERAREKLEKLDYEMLANREQQRLRRVAASSSPSGDDIERLIVSLFARHYKDRRAVPPNIEVVNNIIFGELSRTAISAKDISCKAEPKRKSADCSFTINRKIIGGVYSAFESGSGRDKRYSARFVKEHDGWKSIDLNAQFQEAGLRARRSGSDDSGGAFTGGWRKSQYKCQGGHLEDKFTGEQMPFFHPDC